MKKYVFEKNKDIVDKLKDNSYPLGGFELDEDNIVLFIYDKSIKKTKIGLNTGTKKVNDKRQYAVFVNEKMQKLFFEKESIFTTLAMRELSHIINNDIEEKEKLEQDENTTSKEIKELIKKQEEKADLFAVEQLDKNKVLNALDYLIRDKKSEKANPKEIKDLEQRKKLISKLEG